MASIRARAGQSTLRDASQPLAKAPNPPTITPSQTSLQDTLASSLAKLRLNSREDLEDDVDDWDEDDNGKNIDVNTAPAKKETASVIQTITSLPSSTATTAATPPPPPPLPATFTEGRIPPPPPPQKSTAATTTPLISTEERSALLTAITQAKALNKVTPHTKVVVVEKREALLEAIQKGTKLKAVDLSVKKTTTGTTKAGGLAGFNMDSINARAALLAAQEEAEDQTDTDDGWDD